jgi:hypothetical protein
MQLQWLMKRSGGWEHIAAPALWQQRGDYGSTIADEGGRKLRAAAMAMTSYERRKQPNLLLFAFLLTPGPNRWASDAAIALDAADVQTIVIAWQKFGSGRVHNAREASHWRALHLSIIACVSFFSSRHHPPPHPLHRSRPSGAELAGKKRVNFLTP